MPSMTVVNNYDGGRKLLNYPKYIKNSNRNAHVRVFKQVIKVNGVTQEGTKIVYFQWRCGTWLQLRVTTLWTTTLTIPLVSLPKCFIKGMQGLDEWTSLHDLENHQTKFEWKDRKIFSTWKFFLQHSMDNRLLNAFFKAWLLPYLRVAIVNTKRGTLIQHL
jgi:hypothetical protein